MNEIKPKTYQSYRYKDKVYHINPFQISVLKEIKSLPKKHLHYVVGQQSLTHSNINLRQMKSLIKRGIREYISQLNYPYKRNFNPIKYYCVFETDKKFNDSQYTNEDVSEDFNLGLHFHLFITSDDNFSCISFPTLIHGIFHHLSSIKGRQQCISKYDYVRINQLNDPFILYHTKQFYQRPTHEMVMIDI